MLPRGVIQPRQKAAMGAASFVNLSRIALTIERLEEKQAGQIGVPSWKAKSIFRVFGTKQNYSSPDADDRWFQILTVEIQNQQPPIYVSGDQVAVIAKFDPGSSRPAFPAELIRDVLLALDAADPPLSSAKQSGERYAVPVIAQAIAPHRGGRADDTEGKNVLDHLLRSDFVRVENVKLSRTCWPIRYSQVLSAHTSGQGGYATRQRDREQIPAVPAESRRANRGVKCCMRAGIPKRSPAPQGGCGGKCGAGNTRHWSMLVGARFDAWIIRRILCRLRPLPPSYR